MKTIYDTGKRTGELLQDLKQLVEIPSVRNECTAGSSAPFGKEIRNAMDVSPQIAQWEGFGVHDFDGYAIDAQLGKGGGYIGVLAHLDAVEAGERSHWHGDPSRMQEVGDMLHGRGVNDDKGPLLIALYTTACIRQEGRILYHPVHLITGGTEETTWERMEYYFKHNPRPIFDFSPDDNFPVVSGEKGILQVRFLPGVDPDISLHCRGRPHTVCDDLRVTVPKGSDISFVEHTNLIEVMQDSTKIIYRGVRALPHNPQRGDNAIFKFVKDFHGYLDQTSSLYPMVNMIYEDFLDDSYGKKGGLYHEDAIMGCGSVCLMSLNTQDGQLEPCVGMRYVQLTDEQDLPHTLRKTAQHYGCELEVLCHKRLFHVAEDNALIQSLKTVYHRVTKEDAVVFTKRGASYVCVLEHGAAFGATFPGEDLHPHIPNEYMPVKSLLKASDIYHEALMKLTYTKR